MTNKEKLQDLLEQAKALDGQISEDELKEVIGGASCACFVGGGGPAGGKDKTCACVVAGAGERTSGGCRCSCGIAGSGHSEN